MKKYDILSVADFMDFIRIIGDFIDKNKQQGNDFKKMSFTVKSYRKDKTPKQHKFYWIVIAELVKAFKEAGYDCNSEEIHEFIKREHGYTKEYILENGTAVHLVKSISDDSEDVNRKVMMELIDFCIRFAAINLNYVIRDPRDI